MKNLFAAATLCIAFVSSAVNALDIKKISWDTLNEHVVRKEIKNPFEDMAIEDIRKMQQIAIVEDIISSGQPIDDNSKQLAENARIDLQKKGIDIDKLFAIREQIIAQRELEYSSTNPVLENTNIEMSGFLLPLEFEGKKVKEFLLVPYVGACIHEPPPAANQIVYAKLETPVEPPSLNLFTAIKVQGLMTSQNMSPELSLVDGAKQIPTSYTLDVDAIEFIEASN
ncbi:DUF3299 domain-containing protein [Thalassotalea maritima]|uniref:DUF3299 domain-containing protein n=1 Tax=Thalassotalea maritima TaxID=3242416 RepID=UPI003527D898